MKQIRVLVADDEAEFTVVLAKLLRRRGMAVEVREDASAALEAFREREFDVALLDVKMPGMSGIACLSEMRRLAPEVPVILLTGHLAVQDERDGMSAGAFAYLLKPHPFPDLVAHIERAAVRKAAHSRQEKG